jgi:hypothetical protein
VEECPKLRRSRKWSNILSAVVVMIVDMVELLMVAVIVVVAVAVVSRARQILRA